MDIAHFPWVHVGTFGLAQDTLVPKIDLQPLDDSFYGYRYEVEVNNPDEARATSGQATATLTRTMTTGFSLPFLARSTIRYESGLEHILLLCTTPIDDVTSYFTFVVWRNDDFSVPAEDVVAFDRAIGAEDKVMLERVPACWRSMTATVSVQSDRPPSNGAPVERAAAGLAMAEARLGASLPRCRVDPASFEPVGQDEHRGRVITPRPWWDCARGNALAANLPQKTKPSRPTGCMTPIRARPRCRSRC